MQVLKIWCSCFQDSLACIISPYGWAGNTLKMLPAHTSHLGFETTVTFAEEKRYVCLFMPKLRKKFACILITVTLQNLCKWHWSECLRWGGGGEALGASIVQWHYRKLEYSSYKRLDQEILTLLLGINRQWKDLGPGTCLGKKSLWGQSSGRGLKLSLQGSCAESLRAKAWSQKVKVCVPPPSLTSFRIGANLTLLWFILLLWKWDKHSSYLLKLLWGFNEFLQRKCLESLLGFNSC